MIADVPDIRVLALLDPIIDSYPGTLDPRTGMRRGLPMGNQTGQWFALHYLDPMDRLTKERMPHYARYMDDGVLLHPNKDYLREVLAAMREEASLLKLEFNQKTQVFPVSQGVGFLGWHLYLTDMGKVVRRLSTQGKRRWKRRLRRFREEYGNDEKTLDEINRSIVSYNGHLSHGHTHALRSKVMGNFVLTRGPRDDQKEWCN